MSLWKFKLHIATRILLHLFQEQSKREKAMEEEMKQIEAKEVLCVRLLWMPLHEKLQYANLRYQLMSPIIWHVMLWRRGCRRCFRDVFCLAGRSWRKKRGSGRRWWKRRRGRPLHGVQIWPQFEAQGSKVDQGRLGTLQFDAVCTVWDVAHACSCFVEVQEAFEKRKREARCSNWKLIEIAYLFTQWWCGWKAWEKRWEMVGIIVACTGRAAEAQGGRRMATKARDPEAVVPPMQHTRLHMAPANHVWSCDKGTQL